MQEDLHSKIKELIKGELTGDVLQAMADALEQDLKDSNSDRGYQLKRNVTIAGLRQLAQKEAEW